MCIFAREFRRTGNGVQVWRTIRTTFKGNGGHGGDRAFGKPLFQIVIFRPAFSAEPPATIMIHDPDMVRASVTIDTYLKPSVGVEYAYQFMPHSGQPPNPGFFRIDEHRIVE